MSLKIAAAGVVGAAALGMVFGARLTPRLATRAEGPVEPLAMTVGDNGPTDLTPAYIGPRSLRTWQADAAPASWPDRVEGDVRRDLAQADAELRASEAELAQYHRAAVLVTEAAAAADRLGAMFSSDKALGGRDRAGPRAYADPGAWGPASPSDDEPRSESAGRYSRD